ncbi:MAG: hypothetical protein ACYCT9_00555 [Leptospirillum sp.]
MIKRMVPFGFLSLFLASCGGGGSSAGGNSPTPASIAFYVYGNVSSGSGGNGNTVINGINTDGILSGSVTSGPQTGVTPAQEVLVTVGANRYLYVANTDSGSGNTISVFSVNGANLTSLPQIVTSSDLAPQTELVYSAGVLFVPLHNGDISSYTVNSDGSLTLINGDAYTVANGAPLVMTLDITGHYLVVGEYGSATTWDALCLSIGSGGTLSLSSSQTGIAGDVSYFYADPSSTNGDYLYGSYEGEFYTLSINSGTITVTADSSIVPNNNTTTTPAWIDPTGTWLFLAELDGSNDSETLVQYRINSDGSLTAGTMSPIQIATGSNGSVGGFTESPGFYDSANVIVEIPVGGYLTTYSYNSSTGSLTALSLHTGNAPGGIMVAYAQ